MSSETYARKGSGCLRWLGRVVLGALALLLALMAVGAVYQAVGSAQDEKAYKPTDKLAEVDGIRMVLDCRGEGSPTVILEAGAGAYSLAWARVQDEIAMFTRVCSYDRAGMGWSDAAPEAQSPDQVAETLHNLLTTAGVEPPYIMVGHSLGGIFVRAFMRLQPDEVAGMVLVDSSHENQNQLFPPEFVQVNESQLSGYRFCQATAPFGLVRAVHLFDYAMEGYPISQEEKRAVLASMYRTGFCGAGLRELETFNAFTSQPHELASLGDLPLIVLSAGASAEESYAALAPAARSVISFDVWKKMTDAQKGMQEELARLSTRSKHIYVAGSGHNVQLDAPGYVIDAVREVFEMVVK